MHFLLDALGIALILGLAVFAWRRTAAQPVLPPLGWDEDLARAREERDAAWEAVTAEIERREKAEAALRVAQQHEAAGQLTAGIAHDFNNLLQAVAGNLELIARKPGDEDSVVRWSANALDAVQRGRRLTSQLLAFSRARQSEVVIIRLADLIADVSDLLERAVGPHCRLEIVAIDPQINVEADPLQVDLELLDHILRAREGMSEGCTFAIAAGRGGKEARVTLTAGDRELARIALPLAAAEPRRVVDKSEGYQRRIDLTGAKILLIDDDAQVRASLAETLAASGAVVREADGGESGLEMLAAETPGLVIVDFAMPGMSGLAVAERALTDDPALPVVLITGLADLDTMGRAPRADVTMLQKPFESHELLQRAAQLLGR